MSSAILFLLGVLALPLATAQENVLFAISKYSEKSPASIDAIATFKGLALSKVPTGCDGGTPTENAFFNKHLAAGKKYLFVYQGARQGEVEVLPLESESAEGYAVKLNAIPAPIFYGLASNSPNLGRHATGAMTQPNARIKLVAMNQAKRIFMSKGSRIRPGSLEVTAVVPFRAEKNGLQEFAVSAEIARADGFGLVESIFFISTLRRQESANLVWYKHAPTETDGERMMLVGNVDLNGDGVDEIVTKVVFYENYQYRVLKRTGRRWVPIFKTDVLGCL